MLFRSAARANMVKIYATAIPTKRIDIILMNYSNFTNIVDGHREGLFHVISSEKAYNRMASNGDLGIRVQKSGRSDITANTAIDNVTIRESIKACDFSGDLLEDTDQDEEEQLRYEILTLQMMQEEYDVVTAQLQALRRKESRLLFQYLLGEKEIQEIAEEEGITYESAKQKLKRVRNKLKMNVTPFMREQL